jgi:dephospho-CoA kinase
MADTEPDRMLRVTIKLVGLTGGIGSGKSTIAAMIREQGIPVLDADVIAREVVAPGQPALADIAAAWPEVIAADGTLERKRLGDIVFADKAAQARLEAFTHPRIRERIAAQAAQLAAAGHGLAFLEAALLVESGLHRQLDGLVVVAASEDVQVARVMARDGCSRDGALRRIRAQCPLPDKVRVADYVLDNDGSLDEVRARLLEILRALGARAKLDP